MIPVVVMAEVAGDMYGVEEMAEMLYIAGQVVGSGVEESVENKK